MAISILNEKGEPEETYKVVEMHIGEAGGPVAVNVWHIFPRSEWTGERVE
jgi:hypothetical protein